MLQIDQRWKSVHEMRMEYMQITSLASKNEWNPKIEKKTSKRKILNRGIMINGFQVCLESNVGTS